MTLPDLPNLLALIGLAATATAAVGYLVGKVRKAARAIDAIQHLVERELEHNHGSSMKDDVHGLAVALGKVGREVDRQGRVLANVVENAERHHPESKWRP